MTRDDWKRIDDMQRAWEPPTKNTGGGSVEVAPANPVEMRRVTSRVGNDSGTHYDSSIWPFCIVNDLTAP